MLICLAGIHRADWLRHGLLLQALDCLLAVPVTEQFPLGEVKVVLLQSIPVRQWLLKGNEAAVRMLKRSELH